MNISSILRPRIIVAVALALIMGSAAYGFAASNAIPDTNAGAGVSVVSGYHITDVIYGLNGADPSKLDTVTFTMKTDADETTVAETVAKVNLVGTTWVTAVRDGVTDDWTVTLSSIELSSVDKLNIVAYTDNHQ
ncbi:hypothetical protein EKD04_008855 [Chloroflexales bacterium ZM16-3]|nr:hypothetical protein [Chloroflexales bacterium ZM16-3]